MPLWVRHRGAVMAVDQAFDSANKPISIVQVPPLVVDVPSGSPGGIFYGEAHGG